MTTFAEYREQITPLVHQELAHEAKDLGDLTVDIIWNGRQNQHAPGLTPARVDLVLRQLARAGEIEISEDGEVRLLAAR